VTEPVWIRRDLLVVIHERLLAEHGGAPGIRDEGLLESALARPRQILAYQKADLAELAAAYTGGILRNHPFIDGNKRTGFMAAYVFLARSGMFLRAPEHDAAAIVLELAAARVDEAAFADWLRTNCRKRK
jgi:death-on-curing protein